MLSIVLAILTFLSVVIIIVVVHEFGHFSVAKFFGMKVQRFSIGFGKPLWSFFDKEGTEYALAPIPLGGYVKLVDTREGEVAPEDLPYAFDQRPLYQRFLVVLAGPLFNFIFAIICFWAVLSIGVTTVKPIVGTVIADSPAAKAGVKPGEQIIAVNGRETFHWAAVSMALVRHYGEKGFLNLTVKEPEQTEVKTSEVHLDLQNWKLDALKPNPLEGLGIKPYIPNNKVDGKLKWPKELLQERSYPLFPALIHAVSETYNFITFNFIILSKMITGVISWRGIGGPLTIMEAAAIAAKQGFVIYVNFLALLSISIGILNLLPIPGLDGGQIFFQLIELLRGKPVSVRVQLLVFRLGIIILLLIMVQAIVNDLLRI